MLFFIFCLAQTSNNEVIVHTSNTSEPKAQTALNGLLFLDSFLFERMLKTHSSPSHLLFLFANKKRIWKNTFFQTENDLNATQWPNIT